MRICGLALLAVLPLSSQAQSSIYPEHFDLEWGKMIDLDGIFDPKN